MRKKFVSVAIVIAFAGCSGTGSIPLAGQTNFAARGGGAGGPAMPSVTAPKRFKVSVFARGDSKHYNPDPIVFEKNSLYVAYQNATQPTGSGGKSTIVEYDSAGKTVGQIEVKGRCDGMRWDPYSNLMWLTVNEDANSSMFTWDPSSGNITHYKFSSASHGGGYDDLAFAGNQAFIAASNPKLNTKGINTGPALVSVVLSGKTAEVTPVLMGDAEATDIPTGKKVQLNLTDPDSTTVAPDGDVLLVSQADEEIVFIHAAGTKSQSVSRLLVGTQLDDTVYATQSRGYFYVVDEKRNIVYLIAGGMRAHALYTETPDDSGVRGFVGTVSKKTGGIRPVITGFASPSGLTFAPRP
jgi:hypothetical protein